MSEQLPSLRESRAMLDEWTRTLRGTEAGMRALIGDAQARQLLEALRKAEQSFDACLNNPGPQTNQTAFSNLQHLHRLILKHKEALGL